MKTIINNADNTLIIKKSKFITYLCKINNEDEIKNILLEFKKKYDDSSHICYAYIINSKEKCFDDHEPNGCAGLPILNVLKKNELTNIIAITIRYFGGIKLGTSGLIHAYSNSIICCLKNTKIKEIEEKYLIEIIENYEKKKLIDNLIKDEIILNKNYQDNISYKVIIKKETLDKLSNVSYKIIDKINT